jgi:hypothetical protein
MSDTDTDMCRTRIRLIREVSLLHRSSLIEVTSMKALPFIETKQKVGGEGSLTSK